MKYRANTMNIEQLNWHLNIALSLLARSSRLDFPIDQSTLLSEIRAAEVELKDALGLWRSLKFGGEISDISKRISRILLDAKANEGSKRKFKLDLMTFCVVFVSEVQRDKGDWSFAEELGRIYSDIFLNIEAGIYPGELDKESLNDKFKYSLDKLWEIYSKKIN